MSKSFWTSRTEWAGLLTVLISVGTDIAGLFPEEHGAKITAAVGVMVMVLRAITTQPVTISAAKSKKKR